LYLMVLIGEAEEFAPWLPESLILGWTESFCVLEEVA
jgi:hypothetical protein